MGFLSYACWLSSPQVWELHIPTGPHKESDVSILFLLLCVNCVFNQLIKSGTFFLKCAGIPACKWFYPLRLEIWEYRCGNIFRVHRYWIIMLYSWYYIMLLTNVTPILKWKNNFLYSWSYHIANKNVVLSMILHLCHIIYITFLLFFIDPSK